MALSSEVCGRTQVKDLQLPMAILPENKKHLQFLDLGMRDRRQGGEETGAFILGWASSDFLSWRHKSRWATPTVGVYYALVCSEGWIPEKSSIRASGLLIPFDVVRFWKGCSFFDCRRYVEMNSLYNASTSYNASISMNSFISEQWVKMGRFHW